MTTTNKIYQLTCTFLSVTKARTSNGFSRIVNKRETDHSYLFEARTKKECVDKAKRAGRYGSFYANKWEVVYED